MKSLILFTVLIMAIIGLAYSLWLSIGDFIDDFKISRR